MRKPHHLREIGRQQEQRIIEILKTRRCTARELAAELGIYISRVNDVYLPRLRGLTGRPRKIFIAAFVDQPGKPPPLYALGTAPDTVFVANDPSILIKRMAAPQKPQKSAASWMDSLAA